MGQFLEWAVSLLLGLCLGPGCPGWWQLSLGLHAPAPPNPKKAFGLVTPSLAGPEMAPIHYFPYVVTLSTPPPSSPLDLVGDLPLPFHRLPTARALVTDRLLPALPTVPDAPGAAKFPIYPFISPFLY